MGVKVYFRMTRISKHKFNKSLSQRQGRKKKMSKGVIITIILAGIMIFSVFGIIFGGYDKGSEIKHYNDIKFILTEKGWAADIGGKKLAFDYFPGDLEEIKVDNRVKEKLRDAQVVYLTFNPGTKNVQKFELLRFNLQQSLLNGFNIMSIPAISIFNQTYNQPVITCKNATYLVPVINIIETKNATESGIGIKGDCVELVADEYSTKAVRNRLEYFLLGVMS